MFPARPTLDDDRTPHDQVHETLSRRARPRTGPTPVAPLSARRPRGTSARVAPRSFARAGAGAMAAVAVAAGTMVAVSPAASADPVPYYSNFHRPAMIAGSENDASVLCPGSAGTDVPVHVTDPLGAVTDHLVPSELFGSDPYVRLEVGPTGAFEATELGTWTAEFDCPGYDPYTTSFQVMAPTLGVTVAIDRDHDCATIEEAYLVGDDGGVCFTVTNTTGQDIRRLAVSAGPATSYSYPAAGEFPAGAVQTHFGSTGNDVGFDGDTITGLSVWAELGTQSSGMYAVSDTYHLDSEPLGAALALEATTGLDAGSACAADGGQAARTVAPGTPVYLCYEVTNTSGVDFHFHDVADSRLGMLYDGLENDLAPGESMTWSPAQPLVVTGDEIHTGTWTSTQPDDAYEPLPESYVATASATATISVTAAPTPTVPTTTPPTTAAPAPVVPVVAYVPVVVTTQAAPAVAVVAQPRMAG